MDKSSEGDGDFVTLGRSRSVSSSSSIGGEVDLAPSEEELLRILECPVCTEFPSPPIYTCTQGHFVCSGCIQVLSTCPECNSAFGTGRNYAVEAIVEKTRFKCKYKEDGCNEVLVGKEYVKHVNQCVYRPFKCSEQGDRTASCDTELGKMEYVKHIRDVHGAGGYDDQKYGRFIQKLGDVFPAGYLKMDNDYYTVHTRKHKSFVCWWVSSTSRKNPDMTATLTWTKVDSGRRGNPSDSFVVKWKLPIHHENASFEEIRDNGACAVLPIQHLRQFQDTGNELHWALEMAVGIDDDAVIQGKPYRADNVIWDAVWHYMPLFVLSMMGVIICYYFKRQDEAADKNVDDLFGYRGFYFRDKAKNREF